MDFVIRLVMATMVGVFAGLGIYNHFASVNSGSQFGVGFVTYPDAVVRVHVEHPVQTRIRSTCSFSIVSSDPVILVESSWDEFSQVHQIYQALPAATWKVELGEHCSQAEWSFSERVPYLFWEKGTPPLWLQVLPSGVSIGLGVLIAAIILLVTSR